MASDWQLIAALLGGTDAMRKAAETYLPKWPSEGQASYKTRCATATLFPAFLRTIDVLGGKPFSKPLTLTDVPARIQEWTADIDLQGRDLHAFAASLCQRSLAYGSAGILVDYPRATGLRTAADEKAAGMRPYFVEIDCRDVLGWHAERIAGVETLTQFRFLETVTEPDGEFGEKTIPQVRVLYPGRWEIWRENLKIPDDDKWEKVDEGLTSLTKIPYVPVYGNRTGFMTGRPPLMELAHLNVEHWQSKSDQQTILHIARVPILFAKMLGSSEIIVGGGAAVSCDDRDGDLRYVEHSGAAIEAGQKSLLYLEDQMRQVGAELLVIKPANMTVAQTLADNEPGMCALQRIVQDQEHALGVALELAAEWVRETGGGHVSIFQDFGVSSLSEASMTLLRDMNIDGTFSDESLFGEAQRRGIIRPEVVWEDEKARIAQNREKPGQTKISLSD